MSRTIGLAMALSLAALAAPALAESIQVKTSDLDLSTEAGNKTLDRRIHLAARKICGADEAVTATRVLPKATAECVRRVAGETREKLAANTAGSKS